MTRDLPSDGEDAAAGNDTAYQVASGVARVARGGAYVTGGALMASNGGEVPSQPDSEHADSRHTGWARSTDSDPDSDAPSPVVTFPDPAPQPSTMAAEQQPGFDLPDADATMTMPLPRLDFDGGPPTDPGALALSGDRTWDAPSPDNAHNAGAFEPGPGDEPPGSGGIDADVPDDAHAPGNAAVPAEQPVQEQQAPRLDAPGDQEFDLPWRSPDPGHGFDLPDLSGLLEPGSPAFELPDTARTAEPVTEAASATSSDSTPSVPGDGSMSSSTADVGSAVSESRGYGDSVDPFDGIGAGGDGIGFLFTSDISLDVSVGPDGLAVVGSMEVDTAVGNVGAELDRLNEWISDGAAGNGAVYATDPAGNPGQSGALGDSLTGTAGSSTGSTAAAGGPSAHQAGAVSASGTPAVGTAPVAPAAMPAPVVPPTAPPAPVVPAVVAPQPVAATPVQTTIQPDAATTPVANVTAPPPGPSPLTAPAEEVPELFPVPSESSSGIWLVDDPSDTGTSTTVSEPSTTGASSTGAAESTTPSETGAAGSSSSGSVSSSTSSQSSTSAGSSTSSGPTTTGSTDGSVLPGIPGSTESEVSSTTAPDSSDAGQAPGSSAATSAEQTNTGTASATTENDGAGSPGGVTSEPEGSSEYEQPRSTDDPAEEQPSETVAPTTVGIDPNSGEETTGAEPSAQTPTGDASSSQVPTVPASPSDAPAAATGDTVPQSIGTAPAVHPTEHYYTDGAATPAAPVADHGGLTAMGSGLSSGLFPDPLVPGIEHLVVDPMDSAVL